ncbi:MAG: YcxB family protein [Verrucomicrobiaceae bacterium]|nr:YcxB family protein [Verrucomicrobiaceae bacterium]
MPHEFEVTVDSSMMKAAWHAWFFRGQRIWTLLVAAGLVLVSAYFDSRSGGLGTISIIGLTVLGLAALIFVTSYMIGLRRSLSKLDMITDGRAAYRLTDETIEARSSLGSVSLAWTAIAELRRYRDLVLLGFQGAMYSIVPASQIPDASLAFMVERCRAAGAKITDR